MLTLCTPLSVTFTIDELNFPLKIQFPVLSGALSAIIVMQVGLLQTRANMYPANVRLNKYFYVQENMCCDILSLRDIVSSKVCFGCKDRGNFLVLLQE